MKPWETEPDCKVFKFGGFNCVIWRATGEDNSGMIHLCGYIGLPSGHRLIQHEEVYDIDIPIHGGWTWDSSTLPSSIKILCEAEYWIGFDCAHSGDLSNLRWSSPDDVYRTMEYVENELKQAVIQILIGDAKT